MIQLSKILIVFSILFIITSENSLFKFKTGEVVVINNCEGKDLPFKNIKVDAPSTINRGNSIVFKVYGEADSPVEIYKLKIQALINNNLVYSKMEDTPYANLSEGDGYQYTHTQSVPIIAPSGNYSIIISLVNKNSQEVSCLNGKFTL